MGCLCVLVSTEGLLVVPHILTDWSVTTIVELLEKDMFETDRFDYKQALPDSDDARGKGRLRHACCAFANSDGGFIVFGIADDRFKTSTERLVGMDPAMDFPQHFGNYPKNCVQSIEWDFLNPPLKLDTGNVIHVVEIPKSWKAPHASGNQEEGWSFKKRTNQGTEGMTIEEIRSAFLGVYEKRLKLQLLRTELLTLKDSAEAAFISDDDELDKRYSLVTFDVSVMESIIADTYLITSQDTDFLQNLTKIRYLSKVANTECHIFFNTVNIPLTHKDKLVKNHNEFMRPRCESLVALCDAAIDGLDGLLGS